MIYQNIFAILLPDGEEAVQALGDSEQMVALRYR